MHLYLSLVTTALLVMKWGQVSRQRTHFPGAHIGDKLCQMLCYSCVGPSRTIALDQEEEPAQTFISDIAEVLPFDIATPAMSHH
jgi:hypothetical protein